MSLPSKAGRLSLDRNMSWQGVPLGAWLPYEIMREMENNGGTFDSSSSLGPGLEAGVRCDCRSSQTVTVTVNVLSELEHS
jgi:hypothetical protein